MPTQGAGTWSLGPVHAPVAGTPAAPPLLRLLREEFRRCGGSEDIPVVAAAISRHWFALAEAERRRNGSTHLPDGLKQAVSLRAVQATEEVGLRRPGRMHMDEWLHYGLLVRAQDLGHMPTPAAAAQINAALSANLRRYPSILHDVQWLFEVADCSQSGCLSAADITEMYANRLWRLRPFPERQDNPGKARHQLSEAELSAGDPERFARDIMEAMDLDGDRSRVTYPELVAYCLGQRKNDVVLHLYDLSDGLAKTLSPWLLGQTLGGIWHTGIVVHGREYYFGGEIYQDKPGETRFGEPTAKITLGLTLLSLAELEHFLVNKVRPEFTQKAYSVLHHNCNHFTNRVSKFLVGREIPEEVLRLPECANRAPAVLQPLLQRWFGSVDARARATCNKGSAKPLRAVPQGPEAPPWFPGGAVVTILPSSGEFTLGTLGQVVPGQPAVKQSPPPAEGETPPRVWVRYFEPPRPGRRPSLRTELVDSSRLIAPFSTSSSSSSQSNVMQNFKQALRAVDSAQPEVPEAGLDGSGGSSSRSMAAKLRGLTSQGFNPRIAEAALARASGSAERAASLLRAHGLERMPSSPPPAERLEKEKAATPVREARRSEAWQRVPDETAEDASDCRCYSLPEQVSKLMRLPAGLGGRSRRVSAPERPTSSSNTRGRFGGA